MHFLQTKHVKKKCSFDLEKRCYAEIGAVQVVPLLPLGEHDGAHGEVEEHHPEAGRAGDEELLLLSHPLPHLKLGVTLHHLVLGSVSVLSWRNSKNQSNIEYIWFWKLCQTLSTKYIQFLISYQLP